MSTIPPPPSRTTRSLIVNSPYECPTHHWVEEHGMLQLRPGRRSAGYDIFDPRHNTRRTEPLELVNRIRERVDAWRAADYPGATTVTKALLEYWRDRTVRARPFYFCQLEAIETLVWSVEATPDHRQGIAIPGDGGAWPRFCAKMATGAGKTSVMAMVIAWQALNALTYPKRNKAFSKAVFVVAPGITVKNRLAVLQPGNPANVYDEFELCPSEALRQKLNSAEVLVENWHTLMPLAEPKHSVVKKGPESDQAFVRRVLGPLARNRDLLVLNDEAHHAYRVPPDFNIGRQRAEEEGIDVEEATRWVEGIDRIHEVLGVTRCIDLSATPFMPSGNTNTADRLFGWIVSDFGLNDAIEAGLVKTPRVVVRDGVVPDAHTLKPRLYHLYRDETVGDDIKRRAEPEEPLPELLQQAYTLLAADWRAAAAAWRAEGHTAPPLMLTVCNRTETAARIQHYFDHGDAHWPELQAPERTLRVDSKVLDKAERGETAASDPDYHERLLAIVAATDLPDDRKAELAAMKKEQLLREIVDTVGKRGKAGQDLQNVVSVAMLSEGWDAKNVTHILGLRAFTSQLLCEQVIGRGLRRVSHDTEVALGPDGVERELFKPEYVNVFGVPLSIFQDVDDGGEPPPPPRPQFAVEALAERNALEIRWPNVVRIETVVRPELVVDWATVEPLVLDPSRIPIAAELAPAVGGAPDLSKVTQIDLERVPEAFRLQRLVFRAAQKAFDDAGTRFSGQRQLLMFQLVGIVEHTFDSDRLVIPSEYHSAPLRKRILLASSLDRIVAHLMRAITEHNRERLEPIFDEDRPIGSTRDMRTWYTSKQNEPAVRSQISRIVCDSTWELHAANVLETSPLVVAYAKNDHLGFQVHYLWNGARRRYLPDFLIRLSNGKTLVLEIKGEVTDQARAKRDALALWVAAVNAKGGFGSWCSDFVDDPARMHDALARHAG